MEQTNQKNICLYCNKQFYNSSTKNRHIKAIHKHQVETQKNHVICPLCDSKGSFQTYDYLNKHFETKHGISIEEETVTLRSKEEYDDWLSKTKLEINYRFTRSNHKNDYTTLFYDCNRSNTKGFKSNCNQRTEKAQGSIKINGACPSRFKIIIFNDGKTVITFWKTHVGHAIELRSKHLSNEEKKKIVDKLKLGITSDRILKDAKIVKDESLGRLNLLTRRNINYLLRKHNIDKKRHANEMIAVSLKVQEWNADGKNYAFFYKPEGESHSVLNKNDFALGFMNGIMEKKLKDCGAIICMDGTHGANKKGLDLTIMLVKDDKNAGFPVAFFLSNRLDQSVQEVFLNAVKEKIGEIKCQYFMSDDDPKYFNAWIKIMENKPQRLLCSWHVIKNWNIKGRAKIKDKDLKKEVKTDMKKILNQTSIEKFEKLTQEYFMKLEAANEMEFINYLKKYYFQNQQRISMWANCYRVNVGINTNMAVESLNNISKNNLLKRRCNITTERLLDKLEELVDGKMWQRIINIEHPNANNYQNNIVMNAHRTAENMDRAKVEEVSFGIFRVKAATKGEDFYEVSYNELCAEDCRTIFCRACKVCIHRYRCTCQQRAVKTTICEHIHLVCLFEREKCGNSVLADVIESLPEEKSSQIKIQQKEEITEFITAQKNKEASCEFNREEYVNTALNTLKILMDGFDKATYDKCFNQFFRIAEKEREKLTETPKLLKRRMDTEEYFPKKKKNAK